VVMVSGHVKNLTAIGSINKQRPGRLILLYGLILLYSRGQ